MLQRLKEANKVCGIKSQTATRYATNLICSSGFFLCDLPYEENSHCKEPQSDKFQGEFEPTDGPGFLARGNIGVRDDTLGITSRRYFVISFGGRHQALPIVDFLAVPESQNKSFY